MCHCGRELIVVAGCMPVRVVPRMFSLLVALSTHADPHATGQHSQEVVPAFADQEEETRMAASPHQRHTLCSPTTDSRRVRARTDDGLSDWHDVMQRVPLTKIQPRGMGGAHEDDDTVKGEAQRGDLIIELAIVDSLRARGVVRVGDIEARKAHLKANRTFAEFFDNIFMHAHHHIPAHQRGSDHDHGTMVEAAVSAADAINSIAVKQLADFLVRQLDGRILNPIGYLLEQQSRGEDAGIQVDDATAAPFSATAWWGDTRVTRTACKKQEAKMGAAAAVLNDRGMRAMTPTLVISTPVSGDFAHSQARSETRDKDNREVVFSRTFRSERDMQSHLKDGESSFEWFRRAKPSDFADRCLKAPVHFPTLVRSVEIMEGTLGDKHDINLSVIVVTDANGASSSFITPTGDAQTSRSRAKRDAAKLAHDHIIKRIQCQPIDSVPTN